jgi:hypothetical protein
MGQLQDRMRQDLTLRRFSPATVRNYLLYCRRFAAFYMRSPAELGEEIRASCFIKSRSKDSRIPAIGRSIRR